MKDKPPNDNGWPVWKNLVLSELKRQNEAHEKQTKEIGKVKEALSELSGQIGILKIKASAWGVVGGIGAAVAYLLIERIVK